MGVVFLAEDVNLGRQVALKVLDRAVAWGEDFDDRFRQEARTVAGLKHPNIVTIHSLEQIAGDWVIDMPFIEGGSLADVASRGQGTLQQHVGYARDALLALASCHEAGIVHRDVKPNNILINTDGRALLSDFGLAKLLVMHQADSLRSGASSGFFVGTPKYAPPESWDEQEPAPAWDVYSMGMTLYESIAGETPYDASTPLSLMKQMLERPVAPLSERVPGISPDLSELVSRMLARDPAERPQDAAEALELLLKSPESGDAPFGSGTVRLPRKRARKTPRPASRNRRSTGRLPAIVSTVLILALITAGALMGSRPLWRAVGRSFQAGGPSDLPNGYQAYDTVEPATQEVRRRHWVVLSEGEAPKWTVLAWDTTRLWLLDGQSEGEGGVEFEGHWAEFTDSTAHLFLHGTVSGTGRWVTPAQSLAVNLAFTAAQDGIQWKQSFTVTPSEGRFDQRDFVRQFESSDHVQALMYTELAQRNASWISTVETRFMNPVTRRMVVPFLGPAREGIILDGRLDEQSWKTPVGSPPMEHGCLTAPAPSGEASLHVRYDAQGMYLGLRAGQPIAAPRILLVLLSRFSVPMASSPRCVVQIDGQTVTASQMTRNGRPKTWECDWKMVQSAAGSTWEAEIFVPFGTTGSVDAVGPGSRLRLNCTLSEMVGEEARPVANWGAEDPANIEHGVLLVAGGPAESETP